MYKIKQKIKKLKIELKTLSLSYITNVHQRKGAL